MKNYKELTVAELIETLSGMPPDAKVYFCGDGGLGATYIGSVELDEAGQVELDMDWGFE